MSSFASEKVKVFWDCSLVGDPVSCVDLKLAYFAGESLEDSGSLASSDLNLIIRVLPLNNEVEYQVTTKWRQGNELLLPGFRLNSTLSAAERLEKVLVFLKEVTKPYISIFNNGNGDSSLEVDKPFYISPTVSGSGSKQQGSTGLNTSAQVYANYSSQKWRFIGSTNGGINYSSSSKTAFNPGISTSISYYGASGGAVRSLKDNSVRNRGQWDVALFLNDKTVTNDIEIDGDAGELPENSLHNKARKTSIRAGVEWIAVPFLTETTSGNVALRYSLSAEHHKYVNPDSYQYIQESFARHLLEIYVAKHFTKLDVSFGVGAFSSSFRDSALKGVNGSAQISFRINPRTTLGFNGSVQYAKNQVLSPAEGSMSFSGLTSGTTPLTYRGSVSLTYTLGSIRIFNKEQRWKN